MIKSMTGFGRAEYSEENVKIVVEAKSVNHRYCDIYIKMPRTISFVEEKIRRATKEQVARGKFDIYIFYDNHSEDSKKVVLDKKLVKSYYESIDEMADFLGINNNASVSLLSRFPEVLSVEKKENQEKTWELLQPVVEEAISSLVKMRGEEGECLKNNILEKIENIEKLTGEIENVSHTIVPEYKERLTNRLNDLLAVEDIDESRIAAEVAIFADRCCIDEELVRLESHMIQLRNILGKSNAVGRKIDFLIQEINREINTIGSKANNLEITKHVVELKSEIEKIREQVQNIE